MLAKAGQKMIFTADFDGNRAMLLRQLSIIFQPPKESVLVTSPVRLFCKN